MNALKQISGLLGLVLLGSSCDFVACTQEFNPPSLEISPVSSVVTAPGQLILKSDGRVRSGCNTSQATAVAFYANDVRIGYDASAPFEMTWKLEPGKDGLPVSEGSMPVKLVAITNLPGLDESQARIIQVNVVTQLPR
jgi:hypothetical protein